MTLKNPITPAVKAAIAAGVALSLVSLKRGGANVIRVLASRAFRMGGSRLLLDGIRSVLSRFAVLQFPKGHSPGPISPFPSDDLADEHREIVERVLRNLGQPSGGPDCEQVVHAALRRLRDDLLSERAGEVLEELAREIAFRKWCDEQARLANHASNNLWKIKL